ncbi:MAG: carboxymuconolactone decarboxylase [Thermoleophilia bacterium]|nr:carboxymuconolactone decarboxylase [Thermoleophilia bacterium]
MTDDSRYARGWETLTRINGTDDPKVVKAIDALAPHLARAIVEFGYGDSYAARPQDILDARQRQLVTLGSLVALGGAEDQLAVHVNVALNVGLEPDQIVEAISHALPFAGFPRAINALDVVRRVFERRGVWTSDAYRAPAHPVD